MCDKLYGLKQSGLCYLNVSEPLDQSHIFHCCIINILKSLRRHPDFNQIYMNYIKSPVFGSHVSETVNKANPGRVILCLNETGRDWKKPRLLVMWSAILSRWCIKKMNLD